MICHTVCRESRKRRYYIREFYFTPISGVGRIGGSCVCARVRVRVFGRTRRRDLRPPGGLGLGRTRPPGGLGRSPRSPPRRAAPRPAFEGPADVHRGRPRSCQLAGPGPRRAPNVVRIVGTARAMPRIQLRGSIPLPGPPQARFGATSTSGSRADPRERGPPCAGGYGRRAEAGAVTIGLCMP